jgi:hypothetical protein
MGNLVTRGPQNYRTWSKDLTNSLWAKTRLSVPSSIVPFIDGQNRAAILREDGSAANIHYIVGLNEPLKIRKYFTTAIKAKAINRDQIRLQFRINNGPSFYAYTTFSLSSGTIVNGANYYSRGITPLLDDWFLCWFSCFKETSIASDHAILLASGGLPVFDGLNQDSIYICNPQINEGTFPDDEVITMEVPIT